MSRRRQCAYKPCRVEFSPNTDWHRFHTNECKQLAYLDKQKLKIQMNIKQRKQEEASNGK